MENRIVLEEGGCCKEYGGMSSANFTGTSEREMEQMSPECSKIQKK